MYFLFFLLMCLLIHANKEEKKTKMKKTTTWFLADHVVRWWWLFHWLPAGNVGVACSRPVIAQGCMVRNKRMPSSLRYPFPTSVRIKAAANVRNFVVRIFYKLFVQLHNSISLSLFFMFRPFTAPNILNSFEFYFRSFLLLQIDLLLQSS